MLAASQAAIGMVVQEAHGLETGFRIADKPFRIEAFADSSVSTDWGYAGHYFRCEVSLTKKNPKNSLDSRPI
jgi:hypothetical protein